MRGVATWVLQRMSGIVLVAGMGIHFYTTHFSGGDALTYEAVRVRLDNPYWITFNVAFLLSVIYHGFNGLWGIAMEYVRGAVLKWLQVLILGAAFALAFVGLNILRY